MASKAHTKLRFILQNSFEILRQALVATKSAAVEKGELDAVISTRTAFSCRYMNQVLRADWICVFPELKPRRMREVAAMIARRFAGELATA
jgi:hypothetical protein